MEATRYADVVEELGTLKFILGLVEIVGVSEETPVSLLVDSSNYLTEPMAGEES